MKEFVCYFKINNKTYDIYNVDKIKGKKTFVGVTDYGKREILIEKGSYENMLLTLKHELLHVWLYEKGYKNQQDGCFSFEDICEICALSNNFVNRVMNKYKFIMEINGYKKRYFEED